MTLIEVVIAITLVGILMTGMLFAMRISLNALGKADGRLIANRRVVGAQRALEQEIAGLLPATAQLEPGAQGQAGLKAVFFQGEPESMRFVSTYSLREASRGTPRILEFKVIPGGESGGVRLIVNESPYTGPWSTGAMVTGRETIDGASVTTFRPIETGPNSFILADRLVSCRFFFQERRPQPEYQRWDEVWIKSASFPTAIRVEMQPQNTDPTQLKMISITAPVRIDKLPLETYVDQ
jgi:hypothetical protein